MKRTKGFAAYAAILAVFVVLLGLAWARPFRKPPRIPYDEWRDYGEGESPLKRITPDHNPPLRDEDLTDAEDFALAMGVGSGMDGYDVFRVDATGKASYVFATGDGDWWRAEFEVPGATLAALRRTLVEGNFKALDASYSAGWMDGTQWHLRIDVAGASKRIWCDNFFPAPVRRLAAMIGRDVLPPHHTEIRNARRIGRPTGPDLWP